MKQDLNELVNLQIAYSEHFVYLGIRKKRNMPRVNYFFGEELKVVMEVEVPLITAKQFKHAAKNACSVVAIPAGAYPPRTTSPNHAYQNCYYKVPFVCNYLENEMAYLIHLVDKWNSDFSIDVDDDDELDEMINN